MHHLTVYTSETGENTLYNEKDNLSVYSEHAWKYVFDKVHVVSEMTDFRLLDSAITILETSGHDVSCLSYRIEN